MAALDSISIAILLGSVLVLVGILSSLIALRFGAPLLLVFLVVGMLAGEGGPGGLVFNDVGTTYVVGSIACAGGGVLASRRSVAAPASGPTVPPASLPSVRVSRDWQEMTTPAATSAASTAAQVRVITGWPPSSPEPTRCPMQALGERDACRKHSACQVAARCIARVTRGHSQTRQSGRPTFAMVGTSRG